MVRYEVRVMKLRDVYGDMFHGWAFDGLREAAQKYLQVARLYHKDPFSTYVVSINRVVYYDDRQTASMTLRKVAV